MVRCRWCEHEIGYGTFLEVAGKKHEMDRGKDAAWARNALKLEEPKWRHLNGEPRCRRKTYAEPEKAACST